LLLPAVCLVVGIAAGRLVAFENRELLILISVFLALVGVARLGRSRRMGYVCALFAILFAGAWLELWHRPGAPPVIESRSREVLLLSGCVVEPSAFYQDRASFVLELEPGARARVSLYSRPGQSPPVLYYGQAVEVEARVRKLRNFGNPGAFDNASYMARRGIYWTATAPAGAVVRILPGRCGSRAGSLLFALRSAVLNRLERLYAGRPYETGIMQALLIGEQTKVEDSWTDQYRVTGTYHALVISGMHLVVLSAVIVFLLRLCLLGEVIPFIAAAGFGWLYAAVTGWQTPVVRAAAALTLVLLARYFYRRLRFLNALAVSAIVLLAIDPYQLFETSFQLSFLCIVALAAFAVPLLEKTTVPYERGLRALADRDRDVLLPPSVAQFRVELRLLAETVFLWTRLPERWSLAVTAPILRVALYLYETAVVSASVQVGLALSMATYFHRISFSGVSANMAVVPLLTLAVPVGFLAVITGSRVVAEAGGLLLTISRKVVEWHASWEPAWRIPDPPSWLAVALSASLLLLALAAPGRARWRWIAGAASAAFLGILLWSPFPPQVTPGELELTAIDVGQGDAFFIAFPDGKLMVLDAGGMPTYGGRKSKIDTGEDVVAPYLWTRSIKRLDVVAVSHFHEDHAGGIPALIRNFHPKEVWAGAIPDSVEAKQVEDAAKADGAVLRRLTAGEAFGFGGTRIGVLAPPPEDTVRHDVTDQDSMVLRISYGGRSLLFTGDLEPKVERALVEAGVLSRTDILKVPHHGSRKSTGEAFLDQLHPSLAVISAGYENSYGHPHPNLLRRLDAVRATPLRTDVWGLITIRTDGRRIELDTNRWHAGQAALPRLF
jgi:competence protein ComEC